MRSHHQRVALITGGVAGIGRAIANRIAADGGRVFVTSRSAPTGPIAPGIEVIRLNAENPTSVAACVETVIQSAGRIDILVNNVGAGMIGAAEETSEEEGRIIMETLFWAAVRMIKAVLAGMRVQGSGHILNISSIGGRVGLPFSTFYSAGKFALEGFCEGLQLEVKQFGIHVSVIEPAGVQTPVMGNVPMAAVSLPAYGTARDDVAEQVEQMMRGGLAPDDVAKVASRIVASPAPRLRYIVGAPAKALIHFMRLVPEEMATWTKRKMFKL